MKTLKELSKYTLARYQMGAADDLRFKGVDQGAKISHAISKGGDMRKTDPDIEKRSRKLDKRVVGIGRAANKLTQKTNEDIEQIDEDKKFYYQIGHDKAMAGHERGETSDNYGPMATHYNAGYDAGMKKRKSTKPNVVGKDSYGRDIVKVEGHKTKKKYLKDLRMTMNQATLGDMSTALQKGGFQGKGQYEEVELTEGLPKFGEAKRGYSFIATKTHDDKNHTKHDVHMVYSMLGYGHSKEDREKATRRERIGHIVKDKKTGQHIATATHTDLSGKRLNNKMKPVDRHHDARAALQQSYVRGTFEPAKPMTLAKDHPLYHKVKPEFREEVEQIDEDGHTDVASAMRKCKTIMEDAGDIQTKLAMMGSVESLPSWWTNKLAVAAAYMDSMRDYLLYPTNEEVDQIDELNVRTLRSYRDKAMDDYEDKIDPRKGRKLTSPEAKKRMQGIQRADDKIQTKKILQRQKMGVSEGQVKQDMIKKGYARGNRDVDPRMMIPKAKPKDKQMKLPLKEKHMTDGQMEKREKIVMAMKPKMKGFKDRYGDDAKNVMYATATKMAMKKEDTNLFEKVKKRKVNQKKLAGNDKFEADPTLTSQIMRPDNPSNDNDNKI
tara:strand:- start:386 stop:2206 length:1821 start_codon:yes stop_codon:yes gene_type:complete